MNKLDIAFLMAAYIAAMAGILFLAMKLGNTETQLNETKAQLEALQGVYLNKNDLCKEK